MSCHAPYQTPGAAQAQAQAQAQPCEAQHLGRGGTHGRLLTRGGTQLALALGGGSSGGSGALQGPRLERLRWPQGHSVPAQHCAHDRSARALGLGRGGGGGVATCLVGLLARTAILAVLVVLAALAVLVVLVVLVVLAVQVRGLLRGLRSFHGLLQVRALALLEPCLRVLLELVCLLVRAALLLRRSVRRGLVPQLVEQALQLVGRGPGCLLRCTQSLQLFGASVEHA